VVHHLKWRGRETNRLALVGAALCIVVSAAGCAGDGEAASRLSFVADRPAAPSAGSGSVAVAATVTTTGLPQSASQSGGGSAKLIAHPENIQLGLAISDSQVTLKNPREHDPRALEQGKQLFVAYNCADCHGGEGSGGMGPALDDGRWHFGGTVGEVYESISEGRPDGMPAWGGRISEREIWALVKYVRTLSAGKDPTTENFEGATIQRTGH
jgi:cytochrome c oxidase cbb3-type subunit III